MRTALFHRPSILAVLPIVAAGLLVAACETTPNPRPPRTSGVRAGTASLDTSQVQVELMAFTDSYTALVGQAIDDAAVAMPELRHQLLETKIRHIRNAIIIAAGPNPVAGLLDMTVMVSLQRQVVEEHWLPNVYGDAGEPIHEALLLLEDEIWQLANRVLDANSVKALEALIPEIRARFPGQVHVSAIRASEFAEDRRAAVVRLDGGGSLLQLFQLDPLAGLSPASQELAQTRLLAERLFFWMKRLPVLVNWQMEDFVLDTLGEPETQTLVEASERLGEAAAEFSAAVAELSEWLPKERETAVTQMLDGLTAEREAAITQMLDGITAEREALLGTFENEEVRLRGLLEDVRQTAEATTLLSDSLNETFTTFDRMVAGFRSDPDAPAAEPDPDDRPFDITDYQRVAEAMSETARELNEVLGSVDALLASPDWDERSAQVRAAAGEGEAGLERLIDRAYRRSLVVVLALVGGAFVVAVVYRLLLRRTGGAP